MARTAFQTLEVYRLSEKLADQVWGLVCEWNALARDIVGKQLVRAADSVGANIAEGTGRGSYKDNKRFVRVARGSLNETQHWLRRAYARELMSTKQVEILRPLLDELAPRLNAHLKSIGPRSPDKPSETNLRRTTDNGPRTTDHGQLTKDNQTCPTNSLKSAASVK